MSPYLIIGLSMFVGFVFGYAVCLWRRCSAEEKAAKPAAPYSGAKLTHIPLPPPGATQTRIYGGSGTSYKVAHDCVQEQCRTPHGGVRSTDHTSCTRRRFGSGCVPYREGE